MTAPATQAAGRRARGTRPRLRAVLLEQVRATGLALRGAALVAAALLGLATLLAVLQMASGGVVTRHTWPTAVPGIMGVLLPIAVWARDERFGAGFLWTLPVDRRRHAFTKVLAGWVWLMGGVALFALWLIALTLASGGPALPVETLNVLTSPIPASGGVDPATLRTVPWVPGPLILAVPFTAATATYLLASALALGTRHPLRWVIGIVLANVFASMMSQAASAQGGRVGWLADAPARALEAIVVGRYGLDAMLTARAASLDNHANLTTGELVVVWSAVPELAHWVIATLLWTGAGLLALWAAASRHREGRRA
jgi:hypothetical protein